MKVRIVGLIWNSAGEERCDFECEVLCQRTPPTLHAILIGDGFAILKTVSDKPRFFLFTGSRLHETRTLEEAQRLGELLLEGERLTATKSARAPYYQFDQYRKTVEIGFGLTGYSQQDDIATIQSTI